MVIPSIVKHAEDCRGMSFGLKAYLIHDIGLCANQEDAFYPPFIKTCHYDGTEREEAFFEGVPHAADTLFMVCDGKHKWQEQVGDWFIYTNMANDTKIKMLQMISDELHLGLQIEREDKGHQVVEVEEFEG